MKLVLNFPAFKYFFLYFRLNYLRFSWILLDEVREQMSKLFKQKLKEVMNKNWNDTKDDGVWLKGYKLDYDRLQSYQKKSVEDGDTKEWDISLLSKYLTVSTFCLLCNPGTEVTKVNKDMNTGYELANEICGYTGDRVKAIVKDKSKLVEAFVSIVPDGVSNGKHSAILHGTTAIEGTIISIVTPQWKAIDAIRRMRNSTYAHVKTARMAKECLKKKVKELKEHYIQLGWDTKEIEVIMKGRWLYSHILI